MKLKHWPILIILLVILFALTWWRTSPDVVIEYNIMVALQAIQTPASIRYFQFVTDSISFISLGIPAVFLFTGLIKKKSDFTRKGLLVLLCIGLAGLLSYGVKSTLRVKRPYDVDARITKWSGGGNASFPSGHTTEATAAVLGFYLVLFRTRLSLLLGGAWALLIMFTRIVLGVHNFSDILAGILIGSIGFILMEAIFQRYSPGPYD
jgi:membrane-associated phospholipid phosphatase